MKDNTTALHPPAVAVEDLLLLFSSMVTKYTYTPLDVRCSRDPWCINVNAQRIVKQYLAIYHLPIPTQPNDDPMTMTVEDIFWDNVAM